MRALKGERAPAAKNKMRFELGHLRLPLLLLLLLACRASHGGDPEEEEAHAGVPGHGPSHWRYPDKDKWASAFQHCGGQMQSPIDIDTAGTTFDPHLKPLLLSGYNLPPEEKLRLQNNGHTIALTLPDNMTVSGGGFAQTYRASQLHLHWGTTELPGSEHTVDGHRFPGEIHLVHYSSQFSNVMEASSKPGGLAVLAAFLQIGPDENVPYQHILEHLDDVHEEGEETFIAGFDIAGLLPTSLGRYFRYNGSLTTPPCYQTVNWTVFHDTILLSKEQISRLEDSLLGDDHEHLRDNFRSPQSLHGRRVLASFPVLPTKPKAQSPDGAQLSSAREEAATAGDPGPAPREGPNMQPAASFHTGDMLAVLFGTLFGVTLLAFLLYVHKHRSNKHRLDTEAGKPSVIYTPASTEENAAA